MKNHKDEDDVYDYGYSLRNSLKRLDESKILSEEDKQLIREFLESHLRKDNPAAPLWVNESTNHMNERLTWTAWNRIMKEVAQKADVNGKRIHHYLLRHGSATEAAKHFTDSELKILYGWTMGSRMPATYIHLSARDIDPKLEQIYSGKSIEPAKPEFFPLICPRCGEKNSPGIRFCGRCGTPLDAGELGKAALEMQAWMNDITHSPPSFITMRIHSNHFRFIVQKAHAGVTEGALAVRLRPGAVETDS